MITWGMTQESNENVPFLLIYIYIALHGNPNKYHNSQFFCL